MLQVGGILALFLGISIISIIECLCYVVCALKRCCCSCCDNDEEDDDDVEPLDEPRQNWNRKPLTDTNINHRQIQKTGALIHHTSFKQIRLSKGIHFSLTYFNSNRLGIAFRTKPLQNNIGITIMVIVVIKHKTITAIIPRGDALISVALMKEKNKIIHN